MPIVSGLPPADNFRARRPQCGRREPVVRRLARPGARGALAGMLGAGYTGLPGTREARTRRGGPMVAARHMADPEPTTQPRPRARSPWAWIPSLYLAEGLPYALVMSVSGTMYKVFGITNTTNTFVTSWLYLPWVIKPFWSPVVDLLGTRRRWTWVMQLLMGAGLAGVAFAIPLPAMFRWTIACFWLVAFDSATHDIAADGFYILANSPEQQAFFVGVRSTFYRIA